MKHNNSINAGADRRTEEGGEKAGEERGFSSVSAQGGQRVTQGWKVDWWKAGEQDEGGEGEC